MSDDNLGQRPVVLKPGERVVKDFGPAGTSGRADTGCSIANMSHTELSSLTGAAAPIPGAGDPLAGKFVTEGSPAALRMLAEQQTRVESSTFKRGEKVYHKKKHKECKVVKQVNAEIVILQTSSGKEFQASVDNIVRL